MRAAECSIERPIVGMTMAAALQQVPDPRHRRGQRYEWGTLVVVVSAAVVSGAQTGAAIAQWVQDHAAEWQAWLPTQGRTPSAATIRRTLRQVDGEALATALGEWVRAQIASPTGRAKGRAGAAGTVGPALQAVAVDGKAVRGAQTHGAAVHLVSLVTHEQGLTLAQGAGAAKSNEIPAVQRLLQGRDLRGWLVTLDAMRTQRATAELLVQQGGHYLMVVKPNQPTLWQEPATWFAEPAEDAEQEQVYATTEKAHGRLERRTVRQRRLTRCGHRDWLGFPGAVHGVARHCWTRVLAHHVERSALTYGLTSLAPEHASPAQVEAWWRGHWTIENRSHYVRDVTCREDAGQAWVGQTPQTLAALRNGAIALFRLADWSNIAAAFRHVGASVPRAFSLLGFPASVPLRL